MLILHIDILVFRISIAFFKLKRNALFLFKIYYYCMLTSRRIDYEKIVKRRRC